MEITDHWMAFLEARMLVIQAALHEGRSLTEIRNLIGVDPTQVDYLCMEARRRNLQIQDKNQETQHLIKKEKAESKVEGYDWCAHTTQSLARDKARLDHWWAVMSGGDTVATLKAWATLLSVPRTRKVDE